MHNDNLRLIVTLSGQQKLQKQQQQQQQQQSVT